MERVSGPTPAIPGHALAGEQIAKHVAHISEFGYTVVDNAIEPELLARLKSDVEQIKHVAATGGDGIVDSAAKTRATFGLTTDFQSNLLQKSAASWELAIHPNLLPIIEGVLGHHCLASSFGFRHVGPGEQAQALHTDDGLYDFSVFERPFKKQLVCNSMLALDDFTVANGATRLVPTSHRWAEYPGKPPLDPGGSPDPAWLKQGPDFVVHTATMRAGSIAIWAGGIWHGSGPNNSGEWRTAINMNYCRGVVRQQENAMLTVPRELVMMMPPRLQALVGYTQAGGLGHSNVGPPTKLLGTETGRALSEFWAEHEARHAEETKRNAIAAYREHRVRGRAGGSGSSRL